MSPVIQLRGPTCTRPRVFLCVLTLVLSRLGCALILGSGSLSTDVKFKSHAKVSNDPSTSVNVVEHVSSTKVGIAGATTSPAEPPPALSVTLAGAGSAPNTSFATSPIVAAKHAVAPQPSEPSQPPQLAQAPQPPAASLTQPTVQHSLATEKESRPNTTNENLSHDRVDAKSRESNSSTSKVVIWGCVAGLISVMAVAAVGMWVHKHYAFDQEDGRVYRVSDGRAPSTGGSLPSRRVRAIQAARAHVRSWTNKSARGMGSGSVVSGMMSSDSLSGGDSRPHLSGSRVGADALDSISCLPTPHGHPLCPLLVVPDGTRLACVVQDDVRRRRQELSFDIAAVPQRGGTPLFRARLSELMSPRLGSDTTPGIFAETLGGREQLAFLSTEPIWRGDKRPAFEITRPFGERYGVLEKNDNGSYCAYSSKGDLLLVFSGDFRSHNIQVTQSGSVVAAIMQSSPEEYHVHVQARTDAGLVILALLAIDKCEIPP